MLTIIQAPASVLSTPAKKVTKIDRTILNLIAEMTEALQNAKDPEGVGLAAPQVGQPLQLFIIREEPDEPVRIFINPSMTIPAGQQLLLKSKDTKDEKEVKLEGCLSLQDVWGIVHRYPEVTLTYQDQKGTKQTERFSGFLATIIQHEYDHLQGILFPRRVLEQKGKLYKSVKNTKGETEFEELSV
ncbi:MAG TPA: peptide deformylase [Patescibacteria group bacterium]|nr:peptide deformylase [Patescibacteria group bacterium]